MTIWFGIIPFFTVPLLFRGAPDPAGYLVNFVDPDPAGSYLSTTNTEWLNAVS